jgi:hypothetical protein
LKDKLSLAKNFISSFLIDGSINNDTKSIENAEKTFFEIQKKIIFQTQQKPFFFNYKQNLFFVQKKLFSTTKKICFEYEHICRCS